MEEQVYLKINTIRYLHKYELDKIETKITEDYMEGHPIFEYVENPDLTLELQSKYKSKEIIKV